MFTTIGRRRQTDYDNGPLVQVHYPTRPVDKPDKAEAELTLSIKKGTNPEETAPKQKHVRKCIVYTWDYHSSVSIWIGLRKQPILADEVQTFKALILVHKVLQEGHPVTIKEVQSQTDWLETCARNFGNDETDYDSMIQSYVTFILSKLRAHCTHPESNGLWEYEEYISVRGKVDLNEGYETVRDLMNLQDQTESFQKLIFTHFRPAATNECWISALVPLIKESYGIYGFITSMLRALHRLTNDSVQLEPLRQRYNTQHYNMGKFYYACSQLPYLTGLINVPKLGQDPPNVRHCAGAAPDPSRSSTTARSPVDAEMKARILKAYKDLQRQQAEREQQAQENPFGQQQQRPQITTSVQLNDPATVRTQELERENMAMRGQYERDQSLLEQYRVKTLQGQLAANDGQDRISLWRGKYEALAKLYTQLRSDHLDVLGEFKKLQLKTNTRGPHTQPNPTLPSRPNFPVVDR